MERCVQLAKIGRSKAAPNPSVGCIIVCNNRIIGEGVTSSYGGSHAEVNALASIKNTELLSEAVLYVTLEPCCHHGKTPPCTEAIIHSQIKKVVVGCLDPNPKVAGKGIERLKNAGIEVLSGIWERQCQEVHKEFLTFQTKNRPYILLKWAESSDGLIAPSQKSNLRPFWISNKYSQQLSHKLRAEYQAILVGANTVRIDQPQLTTRLWHGLDPKRFVLSQNGDMSLLSSFEDKSSVKLIGPDEIDFSKNVAKQLCDYFYDQNINSVIVEGGLQTISTFIKENLWDEAMVFESDQPLRSGVKSPKLTAITTSKKAILNDTLKRYHNQFLDTTTID